MEKVLKSNKEWKKELSNEQFYVLRSKGNEPAFTGKYYNFKVYGHYYCSACGNLLFNSDAKFDSGTGWPSFHSIANTFSAYIRLDNRFGIDRTEVLCSQCDSHLGHVYNDGPEPTGIRYSINSLALKFDRR